MVVNHGFYLMIQVQMKLTNTKDMSITGRRPILRYNGTNTNEPAYVNKRCIENQGATLTKSKG